MPNAAVAACRDGPYASWKMKMDERDAIVSVDGCSGLEISYADMASGHGFLVE